MSRIIPDPTGPTTPLESQEVGQATLVSWTRLPGKGKAQVTHRVTTIPELVCHIRTNEILKQETVTLRALLAPDGSKTDRFDKAKPGLEAIMPAVCAPAGTPVKGMMSGSLPGRYHSGRYSYDVDQGALELARVMADLTEHPSVEIAGTSSSGSALWCVVQGPKLGPEATHPEYLANWEAIKARLPGSAQVATSGESHNINRLRFMVHDPNLFYNPAAVPMEIPPFSFKTKTPAAPAAGGKRSSGKAGKREKQAATDVEEMRVALDHLAQVKAGKDDEKLLAVGMCMKAMGHSFEEFNTWAVRAGCTCSNLPYRWKSFHAADTTYSAIIGMAVNAGWKNSAKQEASKTADTLDAAAAFVAPSRNNATKTMNACRFLVDHGHRLVLAWGDDEDIPGVYAVNENGLLEVGPLLGMLTQTARKYLISCLNIDKVDFHVVSVDARYLDSAESWKSVRMVIRPAYERLHAAGLVPAGLKVISRDSIDFNLRYMGASNGVVDLHEGRLLTGSEVRSRGAYVHASIPDPFDPDATHPAVDAIMPEEPGSEEQDWWHKMRGVMFTRTPNREIVVHMNPPNAGKTTFFNADRFSFGPDYLGTVRAATFVRSKYTNTGGDSHNGGLLKFRGPRRVVYMTESGGELDPIPMNQVSGGEGEIDARDVNEKTVSFQPTAHMVIQANVDEDGTGLRLGIHSDGDSDAAAALRDQLKFIPMPAIPEEERDAGFPLPGNLRDGFMDRDGRDDADARRRRQAWVARTVRQCVAMVGKTVPPPLATMQSLLDETRAREAPPWTQKWLPHVLVRDENSASPGALFPEIYEHYLQWHAENCEGPPATKTIIGRYLGKTYTRSSAAKVGKKTTTVYPGWKMNWEAP